MLDCDGVSRSSNIYRVLGQFPLSSYMPELSLCFMRTLRSRASLLGLATFSMNLRLSWPTRS